MGRYIIKKYIIAYIDVFINKYTDLSKRFFLSEKLVKMFENNLKKK